MPRVVEQTKYLVFWVIQEPGRFHKTYRWEVRRAGTGAQGLLLGRVSWWSHWRQYVFSPEPETLFNPVCMREVADFCERMTANHQRKGDPNGKGQREQGDSGDGSEAQRGHPAARQGVG